MKKAELKKEWLASSATTAFIGTLFVGYGLQIQNRTIELPLNRSLPGLPDWVYFAIGATLFILAFVLVTASMVTVLRPWAVRAGHNFVPIFGFLAWVAFMLSWVEVTPTLREINQWWSGVLYWGGLAFLLILAFRLILQLFFSGSYRSKSKSNDDKPKVMEELSLRTALLVGGFVLFLFILGRISSGQSPEGDN